MVKEKNCIDCSEPLEAGLNITQKQLDGYYYRCRPCHSARKRLYNKEYRKNNPGWNASNKASRRKAVSLQTSSWFDKELVDLIYSECPDGMRVDHIVPLRGSEVSGLHTQENLQYLTVSENCKKNNYMPSMKYVYRKCDDGIARRALL